MPAGVGEKAWDGSSLKDKRWDSVIGLLIRWNIMAFCVLSIRSYTCLSRGESQLNSTELIAIE